MTSRHLESQYLRGRACVSRVCLIHPGSPRRRPSAPGAQPPKLYPPVSIPASRLSIALEPLHRPLAFLQPLLDEGARE